MTDSGDLYASPMLYDILYTPGTAAEVDALQRIEQRYTKTKLPVKRLWFEPACGSGRYLRVAAGRGRTVAGFDRDQGQIEYARGRISGRLFCADMLDFADKLPPKMKISFAFIPVNSIRHLKSDTEFVSHLNQMARVMKPGGLYVVGLSLVDYVHDLPTEDSWQGTRGLCHVNQLVNYLPPSGRSRTETVISHLTVTRPRGERHFDTSYQLHCCDRTQWRRIVRDSDLNWLASCDGRGRELTEDIWPYQLEVLQA